MAASEAVPTITDHAAGQVQRANATGLFAHKSIGQVADHSGRREVADTALAFTQRFASLQPA